MTTRRTFLQSSLGLSLAACLRGEDTAPRPSRILLRSSWQVVNIGDIAHTPGVLALIAKHIPGAEVRLWASSDLSPEVEAMEQRRFPGLRVVKGTLGQHGQASNPELGEAVAWADFLLHGSGPSLVAAADVEAFAQHTGKPFGVYGITLGTLPPDSREKRVLDRAKFAFFRDSVSLGVAKAAGVACPVMEFGPDGAFACDLRADATAADFLRAQGLEEGKFLCCIPRLRFTPYWKIRGKAMTPEQEKRAARNEAMAEHDHAPLREAIAAVVRKTGFKVLVCPEDMSQMQVGKDWIIDKLPDEARARTVWREKFWRTDEALSTYVRSAGLFGLEMHSPIMCIGNGVPAIVGRFAEQTSKGFMWRDIGLGDWLFDFDQETDIRRFVPAVLAMATDRKRSLEMVAQARDFVGKRQTETMAALRAALPPPSDK